MKQKLLLILSLTLIACGDQPSLFYSADLSGTQYLEVLNSPDIESMGNHETAIEIWFRADSIDLDDSPALLCMTNSSGGNELGIYLSKNFGNTGMIYARDQLALMFSLPFTLRDGTFHFMALSCDYNRLRATLTIDNFDTTMAWPDSLNLRGSNLLFGADYDSFNDDIGNYWTGDIDEIRIWRHTLSSETMEFHFNNPAKVTEHFNSTWKDSLLGLWRMNVQTDNYVADESGHANHAYVHSVSGDFLFSSQGTEHP